jgi:lysozyme family protein
MNFDRAFEIVVGHEGGYVNHPADPGGETKFGISKHAYPSLVISAVTLEDAKAIYYRDYWQRVKCDELPDLLRYPMFDAAVNSGVERAVRWLQTAVGTTVDGVIGPKTIAAAQTDQDRLFRKLMAVRLDFMTHLSAWPTFGAGWARRIAAVLSEA